MFNPFKRPGVVPPAGEPADPIKERVEDARYFAEQLVREHVRSAGLQKISKEVVRNALTYAHAMRLGVAAYERELRREALEASMAETAFTPAPELEETVVKNGLRAVPACETED